MIYRISKDKLEYENITIRFKLLMFSLIVGMIGNIYFAYIAINPPITTQVIEITKIDTFNKLVIFKGTNLTQINMVRDQNIPTYFNNPGALRPSSIKEVNELSIGETETSSGKFLVFANKEQGFKALEIVIKKVYWETTIEKMINKYAPHFENNTNKYIEDICNTLKCNPTTLVKNVDIEQLKLIIAKIEGFKK